jgi:predicted membrane-bound dolichyl-phosphate-mannose-protein mannosyltransferase
MFGAIALAFVQRVRRPSVIGDIATVVQMLLDPVVDSLGGIAVLCLFQAFCQRLDAWVGGFDIAFIG